MGDSSTWQVKVADKRKVGREALPKAWILPETLLNSLDQPLESRPNRLLNLNIVKKSGLLTSREHQITEDHTVSELLAALANGTYSAGEVTQAFSKRAAIAQQLTNCLTETFFDQALKRAKSLDAQRAAGQPLGPLHGLPVSIKDSFQVIGTEASIGFVSFLGKVSTQNSPIVDILLELGAVLYVKTNIPQSLMTADSENNIFGRTLNPHNTAITAGGSSGGEGALVAFRGSPIGVGTDVAGSIRIPALCCGTYGFKPTSSRIPYGGQATPALPGFKPITATAGPLANDFEALAILTKAVIDSNPANLDSTAIDVPWRQVPDLTGRKLRLGVLKADRRYPLHPPVHRTMIEATDLLRAAGHDIINLDDGDTHISNAVEVTTELFGLAPEATRSHVQASGEPWIGSILAGHGPANKGAYNFVPTFSADTDRLARYATLSVKRHEIDEAWRKLWRKFNLDAVIAPASQSTAVRHDTFGWPPYTMFLNLLDYPAAVIPFGKVDMTVDDVPMQLEKGQGGPKYEVDLVDGAPCSVQVFTTRMRDEECLEIARVVDRCLKRAS